MLKCFIIMFVLMPFAALAQFTVSGKVADITTKKPIIKASIFLNNTTLGTTSGEDGSFTLQNVKMGQYQAVISALGYETYYVTINVNQNVALAPVELLPKTIALKDVVIKPDADWDRYYTWFKQDFFGPSAFAQQCKILNPEMLDLNYDKAKRLLTATSYDNLIIENKALGYRLRYQLNKFSREFDTGYLYYEGTVLFENFAGSASQQRKWQKNRREAYFGSTEHFLKSVIRNTSAEAGFKTLPLIRKPNPERPPDSLIQAKLKQFRPKITSSGTITLHTNDSLDYWRKKSQLSKTVSYLISKPLRVDSLVRRTDVKGIAALGFKDYLYVMYTKKRGDNKLPDPTLDAPDYPTTIVNITDQYAFFDYNGIIINPSGVMFEGAWGFNRIAKLLPVDYEPDNERL